MSKHWKSGSYLVEAAVTVPIFILAVLMLISSVPVLSSGENIVYSMVDEIRLETVKAAFQESPQGLPLRIRQRVLSENKRVKTRPDIDSKYLYTKNQIQDLISVSYRVKCKGNDPTGIFKQAEFKGKITARAFTGRLHRKIPTTPDVESRAVYIFPEWGMRYHGAHCTYVKGSCQLVYLSKETKTDYTPCKLCDASSAQIGSQVFCFSKYGEVYHLDSCRQVNRYYIEIDVSQAEKQGYHPCSKCGGQ